ncbi:MAG: hypothetical protein HYY26_03165, partial [Acidobacteria bacterium]|nr:hypothetical protein [Acidobacteriota bacterium]
KAYEFYAQEVALKARLRPSDEQWLRGQFPVEQSDAEELLARVPHALAELCHGVGLILLPPLARTVLEQVRFVPLDAHRVLAVVLTRTGLVRDKAVRTRQPFRPEELERMAAYLNEHFRGWTLEAIRREMEHRVAADRSEFLHQALNLCRESFDPEPPAEALHLEGVAHLLEPGREARPEELRRLLEALEEKERLARLLRDCVEAPEQPVRILIGLERLAPALKEFTLIGAPYGRSEASAGSLGLLGRTRMDYARAITAVSYLADLFDRALAEN